MDSTRINEFAVRYTAAWCSQNAACVASFFADQGSLKINDDDPAVGRIAISAAAQGFMTAFPDLLVRMDRLAVNGTRVVYYWTLTGTNTGPGGTGRSVRISGCENWRFDSDGLIAESKGYFDAADYLLQLKGGTRGSD
jgi:steroid delta-isomerase-like uncharacterized protein